MSESEQAMENIGHRTPIYLLCMLELPACVGVYRSCIEPGTVHSVVYRCSVGTYATVVIFEVRFGCDLCVCCDVRSRIYAYDRTARHFVYRYVCNVNMKTGGAVLGLWRAGCKGRSRTEYTHTVTAVCAVCESVRTKPYG